LQKNVTKLVECLLYTNPCLKVKIHRYLGPSAQASNPHILPENQLRDPGTVNHGFWTSRH